MICFIESWKTYASIPETLPRWSYQKGAQSLLSDGGMLMQGTYAQYCNTNVKPLPRFLFGFWHSCLQRPPTVQNSSFVHLLQGGSSNITNQVGLGMNPDGTVSVFYGSNFSDYGGLTLGNGTRVLDVGSKHWIEVEVVLSKTATGSVELRIDGAPELLLTGIRTSAQPTAAVNAVSIVGGMSISKHWFGGMYVGDGADEWLGVSDAALLPVSIPAGLLSAGCQVEVIVPRTAGAPNPPPPPPAPPPSFPAGTYAGMVQGATGDPVPFSFTMAPVTQ